MIPKRRRAGQRVPARAAPNREAAPGTGDDGADIGIALFPGKPPRHDGGRRGSLNPRCGICAHRGDFPQQLRGGDVIAG